MHPVRLTSIAATLLTTLLVSDASAQESAGRRPARTISANIGWAQWDLSGVGSSPMVAVRLDHQVGPQALLVEGSLAALRADEQGGSRSYLTTEVQLQLQVPRAVAPYLGVGAGAFSRVSGANSPEHDLTTSAAAGVRLRQVIPGAVVRAELRVRGIGTGFTGSVAEWTAGIGWAF